MDIQSLQTASNILQMHTQDIDDVLSAARLCLCDNVTNTQTEMFRSLFGGVIVGGSKQFGERLDAYTANKHRVPEVLAALAIELNRRGFKEIPMTGNISEFVLLQPGSPPYSWQWSNELTGFENVEPHYASEPPEDCTQVWGLVFTLPESGGFLAGWGFGEMDLSGVSDYVHPSLVEAAKAAEQMAKNRAEKQRAESFDD